MYNGVESEKRKIKKDLRMLVGKALQESAHLTALQNQIRAVADENYSTQVVKGLGELDEIDYTKLSIAAIYHLLEKPSTDGETEE